MSNTLHAPMDRPDPKFDPIDEAYYDAMEALSVGDLLAAERLLKQALKLDPTNVQTLVGLTSVYKESSQPTKERRSAREAFQKTRLILPVWPELLLWGVLENRRFLRAIADWAFVQHIDGHRSEAEALYRLLLRLNPHDNQGIRYVLAGFYAGLIPDDIDRLVDDGNEHQNWDHLERLLDHQNTAHRFWQPPEN